VAVPVSADNLQQRLMHSYYKTRFNQLLLQSNEPNKARLRSASGPSASRAFTVRPDSDEVRLSTVEMRLAVSSRLGLHYFSQVFGGRQCLCGTVFKDMAHPSTCRLLRRTGNLTLHDSLKFLVRRLAEQCGVQGVIEMPLPNGELMDLVLSLPDRVLYIDLSTTCPAAKSYCHGASRAGLYAAVKREITKDKTYRTVVEREGGVFVPAIAETYGAVPKSVPRLFELLAQTAQELRVPNPPTKNAMMNAFACQLQRGHALLQKRAMAMARQPTSAIK
jgi:hypothetical protein